MDPKNTVEMLKYLEKLLEAKDKMNHELLKLQVEEKMLMRKFYEMTTALGLNKKGCDGSILLDVDDCEKEAPPNSNLRGFDLIDDAKAAVEELCPGVVSCADIIVIATRASVFLARGNWYYVETGRRDGLVSNVRDARRSLPRADIPIPEAVSLFRDKNLSTRDLVLLLGGHTVGNAHCPSFKSRVYNFTGVSGRSDPSINPNFLQLLKRRCPRHGRNRNTTILDQVSPGIVDNAYYRSIRAHRGVLQVDNDLAFSPLTRGYVAYYASNNNIFNLHFGIAMVRLGRLDVLTGDQGQIRNSCRVVNET